MKRWNALDGWVDRIARRGQGTAEGGGEDKERSGVPQPALEAGRVRGVLWTVGGAVLD